MSKQVTSSFGREAGRRAPFVLFAASGAIAAALILFVNRTGNFYYDEWDWFSGAAHLDGAKLFESDNGHLILVPRLIYEGVLSVFGTHYLPFMLINIALVLASALLFFIIARRRVGDWLALAPAVLMMFFGCGWQVLATSVGINANLAIVTGLGVFLALERRTLGADLTAAGLVSIGLASHSAALPVALGGAAMLIAQGRWRRIWTMLVPAALFVVWDLQAKKTGGPGQVTVEHVGGISHSLFDSVAATMAGITGTFPATFPGGTGNIDLAIGRPLAAVAIVAIGYLLLGGRRLSPRFFGYATFVIAFWLSIGAVGRDPAAGRYPLIVLPFFFLAVYELLPGRPVRPRQWAAIAAVLGLGLLTNLMALREGGAILRYHGETDSAAVAALELQADRIEANPDVAGETVSILSGFPVSDPFGSDMIYVTAGDYLRAAREFGPAGYAPTELATAPEYAREFADRTLVNALEVGLVVPALPAPAGAAGCALLAPGVASVTVPPEGLRLRTARVGARIGLRRFAEISTIPPLGVPPRSERALVLPGDELPQPWVAQVTSAGAVAACPLHGSRPVEAS